MASLCKNCEPHLFAASITERAHLSHAAMAMGRMTMDDHSCENFESTTTGLLATAFATIGAVSAGKSKGVNAEHLDEVWSIPHDDAARTLMVRTQSLRHDPDLSPSRNVGANNQAVRYRKIQSYFFSDTLFVTGPAKSLRGNICAQLFSGQRFCCIIPDEAPTGLFLGIEAICQRCWCPRCTCL
jgi:hypothetical protein